MGAESIVRQSKNVCYLCSPMIHYPVKILMAFGCTFEGGGNEFFDWLMRNGYPELGALSHAIQGDTEAKQWLMDNRFPHLAAIDSAIDEEEKAQQWLLKNHFEINFIFAKAVNNDEDALNWLEKNDMGVLVVVANKIRKYLDDKYLDYHKIHF